MKFKNQKKCSFALPFLFTLFLVFCTALCFWLGLLLFFTGCRNTTENAPEKEAAKTSSDLSSLQEDIASRVLRLHIIADSNSDADQNVKLAVRDAVITYLAPYLDNVTTKQEATTIILERLTELKTEADRILEENGFSYTAQISLGKAYFPVKVYGDLTLPAGEYDALKINLGSAAGKNWWCLIFPQLCFVDLTSGVLPKEAKEDLRTCLTDEEYEFLFPDEKECMIVQNFDRAVQSCSVLFDTAPQTAKNPELRFPLLARLAKWFQ